MGVASLLKTSRLYNPSAAITTWPSECYSRSMQADVSEHLLVSLRLFWLCCEAMATVDVLDPRAATVMLLLLAVLRV